MIEHPSQWEYLVRLGGMKPEIRSLADYANATTTGLLVANLYLREQTDHFGPALTSDLRVAHRLAFGEVYDWAGNFRKPNQHVRIGGLVASDPARIEPELELARRQALVVGATHGDLVAACFYHIRFERTHGFRDGNGRVGRALLEAQLTGVKSDAVLRIDRDEYLAAVKRTNQGDLKQFVALISDKLGMTVPLVQVLSPFRLAPFLVGDERVSEDMDVMLERSRVNG